MSRFRKFAPGEYSGTKVSIRTVAERRAIVGKRVGFDVLGSCMKHYGTVTAALPNEIEINGRPHSKDEIEQIVVLDGQDDVSA